MWNMLWPVLVVVASNTVYHICSKSVPEGVNGYASLVITYTVAALCSLGLFLFTGGQKSLLAELGKTNWTAWVLGLSIVGLEFGFLCLYRAGWKVGVGHLVTSAVLSVVLLVAGVLLYKEVVSLRQLLGVAVCAVGLGLLAK